MQLTLSTYPVSSQADHDFWNNRNTPPSLHRSANTHVHTQIICFRTKSKTFIRNFLTAAFRDALKSESLPKHNWTLTDWKAVHCEHDVVTMNSSSSQQGVDTGFAAAGGEEEEEEERRLIKCCSGKRSQKLDLTPVSDFTCWLSARRCAAEWKRCTFPGCNYGFNYCADLRWRSFTLLWYRATIIGGFVFVFSDGRKTEPVPGAEFNHCHTAEASSCSLQPNNDPVLSSCSVKTRTCSLQ